MFSLQMPRITFFLRNGILYCRVSFKRTTSEFSTNERLDPDCWFQDRQRYLGKSKMRNKFIDTLLETISYKIKSLALLSECASAKALIQAMTPKPAKEKKRISLKECLESYIREMAKVRADGTIKGYNAKLNNLVQFERFLKVQFFIDPASDEENFSLPIAERFKDWFCQSRKTNNISSASRNIELYAKAMRLAMKRGQIKAFDLMAYEAERDSIRAPIVLNQSEVGKFNASVFESEALCRALDLYIFQCSTGLSYCDLWSWELKQTEVGLAITGFRGKSKQMYFVPLTPGARRILEKYQGNIPHYTNQAYNRALKAIATALNIPKRLTTHSGRKTFATLMDQQGWSLESISRMLGHSSVTITESYYIAPSSRRIELEFLSRSGINKNGYTAV